MWSTSNSYSIDLRPFFELHMPKMVVLDDEQIRKRKLNQKLPALLSRDSVAELNKNVLRYPLSAAKMRRRAPDGKITSYFLPSQCESKCVPSVKSPFT